MLMAPSVRKAMILNFISLLPVIPRISVSSLHPERMNDALHALLRPSRFPAANEVDSHIPCTETVVMTPL